MKRSSLLSRLEVVWVDQGYSGPNFKRAVQQICGESVRVEVIERESKEFEVLPKRWIVAYIPQVGEESYGIFV